MNDMKESSNQKLLLLYDQGSLKDLLDSCMTQNHYDIFYADTLEKAENIMFENTDITIIVTSIKVNGMDIVSILRKLTYISPDIIAIICTDIIDFRKLTNIINNAPIYKILTFPLDIDSELIPAIVELQVTTLSKRADRSDMYAVLQQNENLSDKLKKVQEICQKQLGARRELYEIVNISMDLCSQTICENMPKNTLARLTAFQKYITKQFFLNLNPREQSMNIIAEQLLNVFNSPEDNKHASIHIEGTDSCRDLLRSKTCFLIIMLFYRLTLYNNNYHVSAKINFISENLAKLKITYRFDEGLWVAINTDPLQKSYTDTIEKLVESQCKDYSKRTDSTSVTYSLQIYE